MRETRYDFEFSLANATENDHNAPKHHDARRAAVKCSAPFYSVCATPILEGKRAGFRAHFLVPLFTLSERRFSQVLLDDHNLSQFLSCFGCCDDHNLSHFLSFFKANMITTA